LEAGLVDVFREKNPWLEWAYTWWSNFGNARANNSGWRIDYFLVSDSFVPSVTNATIYPHLMGSDHCPVGIELN
jgi:exodeoxyribonuclease-3